MKTNQKTVDDIERVIEIFKSSECEIRPHMSITGPSGSGKSFIIAMLAEKLEINVLEINAAQLTKEGTSGNSLSKALNPLLRQGGQPVICFVDEFDKLFISGNSNSQLAHETTNGVQNEFLKVLEADTASVYNDFGKYTDASTKNVLFIFAGAFNGEEDIDLDRLREFGIKTEFLGRVGLVYSLNKISIEEIEEILKESALLKNYLLLFPDVKKATVVKKVMEVVRQNFEKNTIGVRLINNLVHQFFINGDLTKKEAKKVSFQKTLSLK